MSVWLKDVEDYDGAVSATRNGMIAALAFAAMIGLGAILLGAGVEMPNQPADPDGLPFQFVGIGIEAAVVLFAAWRFKIRKGWVAGSIALLLFLIEIGMKLSDGFAGIFWYVMYLAILVGLVNGIRGAWALKAMSGQPENLNDTFA
jgi:hypothetical protein